MPPPFAQAKEQGPPRHAGPIGNVAVGMDRLPVIALLEIRTVAPVP